MVRALFVEDDPVLRDTMPAILTSQGFEVTAAASVAEALSEITSRTFDVLISDLNIGEPGDGFTVVSAMRRTNPECINLILTGFPAFESALQALRSHVDDYLVKPADIPTLVSSVKEKLQNRKPHSASPKKRVAEVIRENIEEISWRTVTAMKAEPVLDTIKLSDEERICAFRSVLTQLAEMLNLSEEEEGTLSGMLGEAQRGGELRFKEGYSLEQLIMTVHLLEYCVFAMIHENLLAMDLSFLMLDIRRLHRNLALQLQQTIQGYFKAERIPKAA